MNQDGVVGAGKDEVGGVREGLDRVESVSYIEHVGEGGGERARG